MDITEKNKNIVRALLFIAAAVCFGAAVFWQMRYRAGRKEYEKIRREADASDSAFAGKRGEGPDIGNSGGRSEREHIDPESFVPDWEMLRQRNPDITGWIRMDNGVDYPVMHGSDNNTYLHADMDGSYLYAGSIFMDAGNESDMSDHNTLIYGHNMSDGSMFAGNRLYEDKDYADEHPLFYYYVKGGYYTVEIFDYIITRDTSDVFTVIHSQEYIDKENREMQSQQGISSDTGAEDAPVWVEDSTVTMRRYIDSMMKNAAYWRSGVDVQPCDRIITLSTCRGMPGGKTRQVIQGKIKGCTEQIPGFHNSE